MTQSDTGMTWTAQRVTGWQAEARGIASAPACFVVLQTTVGPDSVTSVQYELPGGKRLQDDAAFEQWLLDRNMTGAGRLSVSVLAIREQLDSNGLVRECVLERHRGGVSGPLHGESARAAFTGQAMAVTCFKVAREDGLVGDDRAALRAVGPDSIILTRRMPTSAEERLGLNAIIHLRRPDGAEIGCGVGWHGTTAFVLMAPFPRQLIRPILPETLETTIAAALKERCLVRHETRFDEHGFCVIARRRGRQALVTIRSGGHDLVVEPYLPGRMTACTADQCRWMVYVETHEARTILDSWRIGGSDDIAVLTVDPDQQAWRHVIDADGIQSELNADNNAAAAVLHRERMNRSDDDPATDRDAPANQVLLPTTLGRLRAFLKAAELLRQAGMTQGQTVSASQQVPRAALHRLRDLLEPLNLLEARFAAGAVVHLVRQADTGEISLHAFISARDELITRLREELALTRIAGALPGVPPGAPSDVQLETRFLPAVYAMEEAAHCLAMRRARTTVMHAMMVMRFGLTAIEQRFHTALPGDVPWARLMTLVRNAVGEWPELINALRRVRRVWRGTRLAPADTYTDEEAWAVLDAVASFIEVLARDGESAAA